MEHRVMVRGFEEWDIANKVRWINDPANNVYLHYDLPLEYEKTLNWFRSIEGRTDRFDGVIEWDGQPVGLIGLLNIDKKNGKAEYYIAMGEASTKGKGVAFRASVWLLRYAFQELGLNRVYLYTEADNHAAQKLFARVGFLCEGLVKNDLFSKGKYVDRFLYGVCRDTWGKPSSTADATILQDLGSWQGNRLFIKRDDFYPYSFGGNKARKGKLFFDEIDAGDYDCVVTYGSFSSNHCRIVANMAAARDMGCYLISPEEGHAQTGNSRLTGLLGAEYTVCPVSRVKDTIDEKLRLLREEGKKPYFIPGGGHGNLGTQAYVDCYEEIRAYEKTHGIHFDYIFHASGTGTTQAGLVCGQLIHGDNRKIVGISIARKAPYGRQVVLDSVSDYLRFRDRFVEKDMLQAAVLFEDGYIGGGYGGSAIEIDQAIYRTMKQYGIPMDPVYTGKAFSGMEQYLRDKNITGRNVLFIHTGGTPLFFDWLNSR